MKTNPEKDLELHDKINRETGRIKWSELARHFASGSVIYVSEELDLIDVALRIAHDDKASVGKWMAAGTVAKVSDVQAQTWTAADATLWASVVSPFVLVQPEKKQLH
ncbi:DUF2288 domain-containing protein [Massilia sp. BSC265]|uniref:DUF2288 domain-containing protein n=1 Tax=Massilia sp. BSC265 TaxID=1549812 RepID=UPI0004E93725|nr:DUF2288 domain-containing protein [Massilia sp. BSC265]KFI07787.1 hypothetical protein JN27_09600 [Massilia sp. BSC265]